MASPDPLCSPQAGMSAMQARRGMQAKHDVRAMNTVKTTILLATAAVAASLFAASNAVAALKPVRVFILAGQSNMEGKAKVSLLEYQVAQPATRPLFQQFRKDGRWIEREDVW